MGLFNLFKKKSIAEKNAEKAKKIRKRTIIHEKQSMMHQMIVSVPHDASCQDENPDGEGPFGLTKSNPIPVHGIDNIPAYMDKLRYRYESKSSPGVYSFNPVDFVRTSDSDKSKVGSKKPNAPFVASSTSSPNIKGPIDVYNLYSISGEMLTKIYVNSYSLKTSNKVPDGFFHRDEIPAVRDTKVLMELLKK